MTKATITTTMKAGIIMSDQQCRFAPLAIIRLSELVVACFSYRLLQLGIGGPLAQAKQRFEALCKSLRDNYEIYVTTNDIALTIMRILDQSRL